MQKASITQNGRENMKPPLFYARTHANTKIVCVGLNKNIHLYFCWMQNYITCCFAKIHEI